MTLRPRPGRRGTPAKMSKRRERTKTCPSCGRTFHTRKRLQEHLRSSLEAMHAEALEHGLDDAADQITDTLETYFPRKEQQHG